MTISDRIELLRKKQGVSLVHLNNVIGAYRGKITEVRNNKASFDKKEIALLAQALSTSTDYLLGKTDDPSPAEKKEKPPAQGGGLSGTKYNQLTPENRAMIDDLIEKLLKSQSGG